MLPVFLARDKHTILLPPFRFPYPPTRAHLCLLPDHGNALAQECLIGHSGVDSREVTLCVYHPDVGDELGSLGEIQATCSCRG